MTIVAPVSSTKRGFPMYYSLESTKVVYGKVLLDQTIALNLQARNVTKADIVDQVSKKELTEIIAIYKFLFSVDGE